MLPQPDRPKSLLTPAWDRLRGAFVRLMNINRRRQMPQELPERKKSALPDKSVFSWTNIGISVGGGLASAAVFAVLTKATFAGLVLAHFAPLPLMIVALGFGLRHGVTAALIATALLSIWPHPQFGFAYAALIAIPALLACWVAYGAPWRGRDLVTSHLPSWATITAAAALAIAVSVVLAALAAIHGSLDEAMNPLQARAYLLIERAISSQDLTPEMKQRLDVKQISSAITHAFPAMVAAYTLLVQSLNLWGAGRLTQISGRLARPWPDIAIEYTVPRAVNAVFLVGLALTFIDGLGGAIGLVLALTSGLLLAFQGLAVTHVALRGSRLSTVALALIYLVLGVVGWPIIFFTLIGVLDAIFSFRTRIVAGRDKINGRGAA